MKHIFIINPAAGGGAAKDKYQPEIINFMNGKDFDYEIHRSLNKQEIGVYMKQRLETGEHIRFYAIGGDGTISDVVNGAIGFPNAEVAAIPCGTGNDFVRNFTNKNNFFDIEKQVKGTAVSIDAIKINDVYSINMINIGADCEVVVKASKYKGTSGSMSYIRGALDVLPKGPRYHMVYTDENGCEHDGDLLLIAIANGMFCGGGFKSCPKASLNDGIMDVAVARPVTGLRLIKLLIKYHQGTHVDDPKAADILSYMKVKELKLKALDPVNASVDGEVVPFTEAEIKIVPNAINFVVPMGSELV